MVLLFLAATRAATIYTYKPCMQTTEHKNITLFTKSDMGLRTGFCCALLLVTLLPLSANASSKVRCSLFVQKT
jgi:hypothetical protein